MFRIHINALFTTVCSRSLVHLYIVSIVWKLGQMVRDHFICMVHVSETVPVRGAGLPQALHGPEQLAEAREEPLEGGAGPMQGVPREGGGPGPAPPVGRPGDQHQPQSHEQHGQYVPHLQKSGGHAPL